MKRMKQGKRNKKEETNTGLPEKDLESRSRRSNIRIYGVKEGAEGEKIMAEFIDNLLKNLLDLPADQDLGIGRSQVSHYGSDRS